MEDARESRHQLSVADGGDQFQHCAVLSPELEQDSRIRSIQSDPIFAFGRRPAIDRSLT
jgi:hypothetical protein